MSEEFNKKMTHWGQKKLSKVGKIGIDEQGTDKKEGDRCFGVHACLQESTESRGAGGAEDKHLSAEFRKKLEEWQRMKVIHPSSSSALSSPPVRCLASCYHPTTNEGEKCRT